MKSLNRWDIKKLLPKRDRNAHKGDFGKILLLCGSRGYTGAASLAAMGALRTGAGVVYLAVPESIYAIEACKLSEAVVLPLSDQNGMYSPEAVKELELLLPKMDAVLIGPGIGQSDGTLAIVEYVLKNSNVPVVLDADGINVISSHKDILRDRAQATILTPHDGEFIRLSGQPLTDREPSAKTVAKDLGCIVLLKGNRTIITDGNTCYVNKTGNPGMGTGGSGDVLAGVIVSLLGQGVAPVLAAAAGAWLHGAAGDVCARKIGEYGMLPQDMLLALPRLMR